MFFFKISALFFLIPFPQMLLSTFPIFSHFLSHFCFVLRSSSIFFFFKYSRNTSKNLFLSAKYKRRGTHFIETENLFNKWRNIDDTKHSEEIIDIIGLHYRFEYRGNRLFTTFFFNFSRKGIFQWSIHRSRCVFPCQCVYDIEWSNRNAKINSWDRTLLLHLLN